MLLLCYHGNNVNLKLARFPGRPAHKWPHEKLPGEDCCQARRPQCAVGSTGGRNTLCEHFSGCLIHPGFSGSFVELASDGAELGLEIGRASWRERECKYV